MTVQEPLSLYCARTPPLTLATNCASWRALYWVILYARFGVSTVGFEPTRALALPSRSSIALPSGPHRLTNKPSGNICTIIHTDADPVSSAEVNSHFGLLGLGVAPRFLQKVRAQAPKF